MKDSEEITLLKDIKSSFKSIRENLIRVTPGNVAHCSANVSMSCKWGITCVNDVLRILRRKRRIQ